MIYQRKVFLVAMATKQALLDKTKTELNLTSNKYRFRLTGNDADTLIRRSTRVLSSIGQTDCVQL